MDLEQAKLSLKRLRGERAQLRRIFTVVTNVIGKSIAEERYEENSENFAKLEDKASRLFSLDSKVSDLIFFCDESEEEIRKEFDAVEEYRDKYVTLLAVKSKFETIDRNAERLDARSDVSGTISRKNKDLKLPKLVPKEFDGSLREWIPFWAIFERIHTSDEYDDSTKFQYLLLYTKQGSPARELVESFPPLPENYSKAIDQLKSRFGREDLLIDLYVRELLKLVLIQARDDQSLALRTLYDRLSTQLNALDTLGLTSDKFTYFLTPLVESALPDSVLKDWKKESKIPASVPGDVTDSLTVKPDRMKLLLAFLRREVEEEEGRMLVRETFSSSATTQKSHEPSSKSKNHGGEKVNNQGKPKTTQKFSTAAGLVNNVQTPQKSSSCIFCEKSSHSSDNCLKVRSLSLHELHGVVKEKGACFSCLKRGHSASRCKAAVRCILCDGRHYPILCSHRKGTGTTEVQKTTAPASENRIEQNLLNSNSSQVLMQTLLVTVRGENGEGQARVLIDSGSQRSYVTKRLAAQMNYKPTGEETLIHMLFGGSQEPKRHNRYKLRVGNIRSDYACNFDVLDTDVICRGIPSVTRGPWMSDLKRKGIDIVDSQIEPVDILVGADIAGKLMTGRKEVLDCGLVAFETLIGWTLMGRVKDESRNFMANVSMLNTSLSVTELWRLDVLGIEDPAQVKSRAEVAEDAQRHFNDTVKILEDGRYEVRLPWLEGHAPLPTNFDIAKSRLDSTMRKLRTAGTVELYQDVFTEWLNDGVIEEVPIAKKDSGHYLPHRPVYKQNSTTAVRPVFDASAHPKGQPSLNACLAKGPNLIELIPSILLRFRMEIVGVIADIKRAFLQIALTEPDQDFLKFLWYRDGQLKIYRHRRVVFGVNSSPFLLGAVLDHLMNKTLDSIGEGQSKFSKEVASKLQNSWYVDNAVASVSSEEELRQFIQESTAILRNAQFELRGWEYTDPTLTSSTETAVLGIFWDRKEDELKLHIPDLDLDEYTSTVTRRKMLSAYQRIFDPIGMTAPTTLVPKILVQKTWVSGDGWDKEVAEEIGSEFKRWTKEVALLKEIRVPRCVDFNNSRVSIHTFCDASQDAFAAVVYLRVEKDEHVLVHLLSAKSRVSPVNKVTIPRLELLAAGIGARLTSHVRHELGMDIDTYFWSDSTTVLAWIKRDIAWGVFVMNRVNEIRALTEKGRWRHVPGTENPADLLSRGCSPRQLIQTKWWEGPQWLKFPPNEWPNSTFDENEEEISQERKKTVVSAVNADSDSTISRIIRETSEYDKIIRIFGWIYHWKNKNRVPGVLSPSEVNQGEEVVIKFIQTETFEGLADSKLRRLKPIYDSKGIMRIKTKIMNRKDDEFFKLPMVLPSDHPTVTKLVEYVHRTNHHVAGQTLLSLLRERHWILRSRKVVRQIVNKCVRCRRYSAKSLDMEAPPLPEERVRDAKAFEISGCDFAGPLYCREGKVWLVIFTCAIYRAVHLDVVTSLSTDGFMMAFRRFVARRGRPKIMFSDNGTNLRGLSNLLGSVDWNRVANQTSVERIEWRFSPPSAPWWGGFWERMVGLMKNILRKTLGNSSLNREELYTVLTDCEALMNSRPITYYSEDPNDPLPISPMMFLQDITEGGLPDCDAIESSSLEKRVKYRQRVRDDLKRRFRSEYLGQMIQKRDNLKETRAPVVGEIVFIGSDDKKRVDWPIAIVEKVVPGNDGKTRVVHLRTAEGSLCRSVKRVYPLEVFYTNEEKEATSQDTHRRVEPEEPHEEAEENPSFPNGPDDDFQDETDDSQETVRSSPKKFMERELTTKCGRKVVLPVRYQ